MCMYIYICIYLKLTYCNVPRPAYLQLGFALDYPTGQIFRQHLVTVVVGIRYTYQAAIHCQIQFLSFPLVASSIVPRKSALLFIVSIEYMYV